MLELTVRLVASLAVVVGLMLLLARLVGKRYAARDGAPVQVLHRQPLSRSASVAVITVGARVLVVGTTDHQVSLLTELDPDELLDADELEGQLESDVEDRATGEAEGGLGLEQPVAPVVPVRSSGPSHRATTAPGATAGALGGSLLSAQTWRQAVAAVTGKAS